MTVYEILNENKTNLFDFVLKSKFKSEEEFQQNVKQQIGEGLDVQQLNQRIEYFNTFDYIIIDRDAFVNDERHIVQMFKSIISFCMGKSNPIFVWVDIPDNYKNELIEMGVKNLIVSETLDEQKEEILECFSEQGMQRYNKNWKTNDNENFEKYHFREDSVYGIEILSTTSDIISKSISLSLCMYLNEVGANVQYIAPLYDDDEMNAIARLLNAEKQDNYFIKDHIYLTNDLDLFLENTNFIIQDLGYIKKDTLNGIIDENIDNNNNDKKIILCDLNQLEIDNVKFFYNNLGNSVYLANSTNKYIDISCLTGIDKELFIEIDKQLKIKQIDKQENLIDIRTNRNFFNTLIEPNIVKMSF